MFQFIDHFFWSYVAFVLIMVLGGYFTWKMRFFQIRALPSILKIFVDFLKTRTGGAKGIHPLKAFFASVGGMIGIGNVVGIVTALQIGGPGALFWVWVAALIGAMIKYAEIILGLKHRVPNERGGYDGGPIYFLKAAFNKRWIPILVAVLLCIYGVEIYQFSVLTDTISSNWNLNRYGIMGGLLILILYAGMGGVKRIAKICTAVMPFFLITYISMSLWMIFHEIDQLPAIFATVFRSAFAGHAAVGGFVGSSVILAIQHGISRAAYSADLGIGYDSMIQSESSTVHPEKQASLAVLGVFIDNLICSLSILVVLISGVWTANPLPEASRLVQLALSQHFPSMHYFMPLFLFIVSYTTLIAYFCVGIKCARFLMPRHGEKIYFAYAAIAFVFFSFFNQTQALLVMSLAGAFLLTINLLGIFRLRDQILPQKQENLIYDNLKSLENL
jgi:alanine or glycine:cation symporter, AGCS family